MKLDLLAHRRPHITVHVLAIRPGSSCRERYLHLVFARKNQPDAAVIVRRGFTLIELLVVIAIIGVLIALVPPGPSRPPARPPDGLSVHQ